MKVGNCTRGISGFEIKNTVHSDWQTRGFRVSGSLNESGPWQPLVEDELDGSSNLVNFTFDKPVGLQFLKFDLLSYSKRGGGLQYFEPISTIPGKESSKCEIFSINHCPQHQHHLNCHPHRKQVGIFVRFYSICRRLFKYIQ